MRPEYDFSEGQRGRFFRRGARLSLPTHRAGPDWTGPDGALGAYVAEESRKTIDAYATQPNLVGEHANAEQDTASGGYAHRQLFELVQNGADALSGAPGRGRIEIRLNEGCLYCADDGTPIDRAGARALLFSHLSPKRGTSEIGRFGLGFKSVLGVTDAPEFFSRTGSFRFDRQRARDRIRKAVPAADRCPVLRVADPVDPREASRGDPVLCDLMDWATNIVRLPLKPGADGDLQQQMRDFPAEFLLFVEHVEELRIDGGQSAERVLELESADDGRFTLADGDAKSHWRVFKAAHTLSSDARADRRSLDDGEEVPLWWAAPLDRLTDPGDFWAYFPTQTRSLVAGILNAPWKTNEDRQNLLPGPYNDELIDAAAKLIAGHLPELATPADPARHLDAPPRRHEAGDSAQSERLRDGLLAELSEREVVPDQDGKLRLVSTVQYPPSSAGAEALERWTQCAGRPSDWLHHRALPRTRFARVEQLVERWRSANSCDFFPRTAARLSEWLEALVHGKSGDAAVEASRAALLTAAAIPDPPDPSLLGRIIWTQSGKWTAVDPVKVFLPSDGMDGGPQWGLSALAGVVTNVGDLVHRELASDSDARAALERFGIVRVSAERLFQQAASILLLTYDPPATPVWDRFWKLRRDVPVDRAVAIVTAQDRWRWCAGPLDVMEHLAEDGRARYTIALLDVDSVYSPWVMRHDTQDYPKLSVSSPAIWMLRQHGRLRTETGIVPFADALGDPPENPDARDVLLAHPKAEQIKEAFDLSEPAEPTPELPGEPEFIGEEDPIPLRDVWPGFWPRLEELEIDSSNIEKDAYVVRCEHIVVDAARRAGRRQAAPFAKDRPQGRGRRPGRRPGAAYGPRARRRIPPHVDVTHEAPLPDACPACGDAVASSHTAAQYQEDLPAVRPLVRRFNVAVGRCRGCGRRVQGRHPLQTSDALGAAAVSIGPRAVATAVHLHTQCGLPFGKVAKVLRARFGLHVTSGGLVHVLHRTAARAAPTYEDLCRQIRHSLVVTPDETGWRVGAVSHWLWAFATPDTTVYAIDRSRGFRAAEAVLGADFDGVLVRDGWAPYRRFTAAMHQSCLAHLLRRCRTLRTDHPRSPWAARVQAVLTEALDLRNRRDAGRLAEDDLDAARERLLARLERLIANAPALPAAARFARHLATEYGAVLAFLWDPSVDATNWRAEQAIRPAVVTRKVCGGNRTRHGADTQQILATVARTADQRHVELDTVLTPLLRAPQPTVAPALKRPPPNRATR